MDIKEKIEELEDRLDEIYDELHNTNTPATIKAALLMLEQRIMGNIEGLKMVENE